MRNLRFLIIALAAICVLALGAFALVNHPSPPAPGDDDIIIKGGSLEIDCGKNHGNDCFGGTGSKPKHKKPSGKIVKIAVMQSDGTILKTLTKKDDFRDGKPIVVITYRDPKPEDN
jgi:hypothetical protein